MIGSSAATNAVIPPGSTIGILGGGQLGRMLALAAAPLGYKVHIFCPDAEAPAADVSAAWTRAAYEDEAALAAFAAVVDVVTVEFENVPAAALEYLSRSRPTRPSASVLAVTQDRLGEKELARRLGIGTAPFAAIASHHDAIEAARHLRGRGVLKTRRMGYDGKGQAGIPSIDAETLTAAWELLGRVPCILEGFVDFQMEASVLVARSPDGHIASYAPIENRHADHILAESIWPARLVPEVAEKAEAIARALAAALDYVGLMAVELFVTGDGHVLMNEIAPRVHNSGHLTIEAAATSQFEQHIRAICGLPLGSADRLSDAIMLNLLGAQADDWPKYLADPAAHLHLYGKSDARPGRKMGHVTRLYTKDSLA